jgi:predicted flap endonuclease-1-like 5' DNA nuclease
MTYKGYYSYVRATGPHGQVETIRSNGVVCVVDRCSTKVETAIYDPIPDVRDRSLAEARAAVQRAGFTVGEVTTEPGDADDVVLDQFPSPRSVAEPGTPVDLTVSAGPATADEADADAADATSEPSQSNAVGTRATVDLEAVDGIGPTYADRLREAGVVDVTTLLDRDVEDVAEVTRASTSRVENWFADARRLLEGE